MRFSLVSTLVVALAADVAVGSTWFGKKAYNSWHETELERWLSDNNVPYPTPSDRKDLENLVKDNWNSNVATPYTSWYPSQLTSWMSSKGHEVKKGTEKNKDSLLQQVKNYWTETEEQASDSYNNVSGWILDSWTESQLKAFCDRHSIPVPQPRTRDTYLKSARDSYRTVANKLGETSAYPGNWLYESWSESDLKAWCDERGIPVPQPSSRDKLIASVRRNARISSNNFASYTSAAAASAASATQSLSDALFNSWSDSQLKEWADKNGINVPQGSKRNELIALARKHRAQLSGDNASAKAASAYGAATSSAGNQYAQATAGVGYYINWAKSQLGLAASTASASATSLTGRAASSASSAASLASASASSASSLAKASGKSATNAAGSSASSASGAGKASAKSATDAAGSSASSLSSVASVSASKSSSSLSSVASVSASKSRSSASSAWSSLSSAASSASASASKKASKSGSKEAKKAGDAAAASLSKGKHRVQEAYQQATQYVKEEL